MKGAMPCCRGGMKSPPPSGPVLGEGTNQNASRRGWVKGLKAENFGITDQCVSVVEEGAAVNICLVEEAWGRAVYFGKELSKWWA